MPADVVIVGVGVRPETTLAKAAGLEIGTSGGVKVNSRLQTSDPHIWAVGDAIEVVHGVTAEPCVIPLAGPANRHGRIVADNIRGGNAEYRGTLGTAVVLDVREPGERDGGVIPGSVSIPLGEPRGRLADVPKDRDILVHRASGQRSYNACRVLTQHGFRCRNLTGSFKTWSAANSSENRPVTAAG